MENQVKNREYYNKLEEENILLNAENLKLKKMFLSNCESANLELVKAQMTISVLKRELVKERQKNYAV